jgi:hypothetical protein
MDQLDAEVAQLKNELADLRTLVQTKSTTVHLLNADSEVVQNLADLEVPVQKMTGTKAIFALSLSLLMCAGLLDLLHWILLFIYDTNLLVLRVSRVKQDLKDLQVLRVSRASKEKQVLQEQQDHREKLDLQDLKVRQDLQDLKDHREYRVSRESKEKLDQQDHKEFKGSKAFRDQQVKMDLTEHKIYMYNPLPLLTHKLAGYGL